MADSELVNVLKRGATPWNRWRLDNRGKRVGPRKSVNIYEGPGSKSAVWAAWNCVDLSRADLALLDLAGADFAAVDLMGANLRGSNLSGADLTGANLFGTRFAAASLSRANLTGALIGSTELVRVDLSEVIGLDSARHAGPSIIDVETIYRSRGKIPEVFLRSAGVPEDFIVYTRSLVGKAIDPYCFISYSVKDGDFAQRLYDDLQTSNVRCWKFDKDATWGEPVWAEIDSAIRHYDKVVVVCSEYSLQSVAVIREIERALQREDREHKNILFPIRIDDYLLNEWDHARKADVVARVAGDFRGWGDLTRYSSAFSRFLEALTRPAKRG